MKNYIIRLMNKSEMLINEKEFINLADKDGLIYIPSLNRIINTRVISEVLEEESNNFKDVLKFLPEVKSDPKQTRMEIDKVKNYLKDKLGWESTGTNY